MTRYALPLVAVLFLGIVLKLGLERGDPSALPSQLLDRPVPVFDLPTVLDPSARLSSAELGGEISLVNVWATWCAGCRVEHEFLNELSRDRGVPIYGINWRDRRYTAIDWLLQLGNPYRKSGFDEDGRVGIDWGVYGAPETFLIGKDGRVAFRFAGPLDESVWQAEFAPRIRALEQR